MDSTGTAGTQNLATKRKMLLLGGIAALACVSGLTMSLMKPRFSGSLSRVWQAYGHAWISLQEKVDALRRADEENEKLRSENAHLRLVLESEHYQKYVERAQKETQTFQWKLSKETGSRTGRNLASISYQVPQELLPSQLYSLGMSYFKLRDDEKAAKILTFLTGLEGDDTFKTPLNQLLTGIAWYRVENFELADFYFDQAIHAPDSPASRRIQGQARLWKGLVAEKTGKHMKAQFWLKDVLDHDPRSAEARWIDSAAMADSDVEVQRGRAPASESATEANPTHEAHDEAVHH